MDTKLRLTQFQSFDESARVVTHSPRALAEKCCANYKCADAIGLRCQSNDRQLTKLSLLTQTSL